MRLVANWWLFFLRGILALVFGIAALFFPQAAFLSLVFIFGAFALVDGIFALISAFTSNAKSENWWWLIFEGVVGILIGVLTIIQPTAMGEAWLLLIGVWAIATGIFEIITAIRLRKVIVGEIWMILSGVVSVAFGALLMVYPTSGAVAIGIIVGVFAILFGILFIMFALNLRKFKNTAVT